MGNASTPPAEQPPQTLLAGKLTVPLLQPGIVTRNRLLEMLDETRTPRLCLVVAPAGWGKTTLLTEWARQASDRHTVAWITLDETDDEPHRFWTYVVTALRTAAPGLGGGALAALRVPGIDPLDVALPALLNDLSASRVADEAGLAWPTWLPGWRPARAVGWGSTSTASGRCSPETRSSSSPYCFPPSAQIPPGFRQS